MVEVPKAAREVIYQDAVDEAIDRGETRMLAATWQDPPCLKDDVDVEYGAVHEHPEGYGTLLVEVKAKVGRRIVFVREYELAPGGTVLTWEDV